MAPALLELLLSHGRLPLSEPVADDDPCPFFLFVYFFLWKKAYMPIDANHISNPKDRYSKPQESVGATAHPMTREAASPRHDVR